MLLVFENPAEVVASFELDVAESVGGVNADVAVRVAGAAVCDDHVRFEIAGRVRAEEVVSSAVVDVGVDAVEVFGLEEALIDQRLDIGRADAAVVVGVDQAGFKYSSEVSLIFSCNASASRFVPPFEYANGDRENGKDCNGEDDSTPGGPRSRMVGLGVRLFRISGFLECHIGPLLKAALTGTDSNRSGL